MRLEEVLPELTGSLALSELFFRGEGPPWAWNRMDQYHRKMRKPVGSEYMGYHRARPRLALFPSQSPSAPGVQSYTQGSEAIQNDSVHCALSGAQCWPYLEV